MPYTRLVVIGGVEDEVYIEVLAQIRARVHLYKKKGFTA